MPGVSLNEVAREAGVSPGTASRALAGKGRVAPETIARVREIADRLGYTPDALGKALREGTSQSVGMIVPHLENPFFAHLVRAVESQLHRRGFQLIVADSHADVEVETRRLRLLQASRVDGIVIIPAWLSGSAPAISRTARDLPLVQIDRAAGPDVADFVGVDNAIGMNLVVEHLISQGARTAMFVGGDDATSPGIERAAHFRDAAERHGLEVLATVRHQFTLQTGRDAVRQLPSRLDSIVCGDDLIALGAIGGLTRSGIRVPQDVLLTGFDGTLLAQAVEPSLTTVDQPVDQIAERAITMLMSRRDGGSAAEPEQVHLAPSLLIGRSSVADDSEAAAQLDTGRA
jgi:LacI family transcriptional regulator